jgi:hypothetical protein
MPSLREEVVGEHECGSGNPVDEGLSPAARRLRKKEAKRAMQNMWACDLKATGQHEDSAMRHAIKRARERYDLKLSLAQYRTLCARAAEQGKDGTVTVKFRGKRYRVGYNAKLGQIVTFLPKPVPKKKKNR